MAKVTEPTITVEIGDKMSVPKKQTFINKVILIANKINKTLEGKMKGLWLAKLDTEKKVVEAEFEEIKEPPQKLNCLWCRTPISGLFPFGRGDNVEMIKACDKDCAHGIKVLEKINKILGIGVVEKEEEGECKPNKNVEEVNARCKILRAETEEMNNWLKERGVTEDDITRNGWYYYFKKTQELTDAEPRAVEFDFINDEPEDNKFGFV